VSFLQALDSVNKEALLTLLLAVRFPALCTTVYWIDRSFPRPSKDLDTTNTARHVLTSYRNSGGTKAALRNMTHTLAMEWATHGIRVNSISPGFVRTQMTAKIEAAPDFETKMKVSGIHPIHLVSSDSIYPTGEVVKHVAAFERQDSKDKGERNRELTLTFLTYSTTEACPA
jgi:NAD(P)-dependent dehydrogenase (short-subunit alcohol dehydrogenase family)